MAVRDVLFEAFIGRVVKYSGMPRPDMVDGVYVWCFENKRIELSLYGDKVTVRGVDDGSVVYTASVGLLANVEDVMLVLNGAADMLFS